MTGGGVSDDRAGAAEGTGVADAEGLDVIVEPGVAGRIPVAPDSITAGSTDEVVDEPAGAMVLPQSPEAHGEEAGGLV